MSEATHNHNNCAAWGCNMLGTSTRSTTGSKDWYCFIHVDADASHWQAISAELNRLGWLVDIVRNLRGLPVTKNWPELEVESRKAIALSQRSDLQMKPSESVEAWMIRLEGILAQSCKDSLVQA